mmetsp:Transcript_27363/g.59659  ORF Transcript_27363/g.59659 Transcript_27363/m.59659 type:complete len:301 (+) Transcript_27363:1881-2783(+)
MCLNVLDDLLLVFAEAEEEAGLRHLLQRDTGGRVLVIPLLCLLLSNETLLAYHVPALIAIQIDIAIPLAFVPHSSRDHLVSLFCSANIEIVRHVQTLVERSKAKTVAVTNLDWLQALILSDLSNLLPMFICTGHEENILPEHAMIPCKNIGGECLVRMAYVRPAIAVVDSSRNVVLAGAAGTREAVPTCSFFDRVVTLNLSPVRDHFHLAVKGQRLLILSRCPRTLLCFLGTIAIDLCLSRPHMIGRISGLQAGDVVVPSVQVRKLLSIGSSMHCCKASHILCSSMERTTHIGPICQQRI